MTPPSSGSGPDPDVGRPLLRAARREHGWSQASAARELVALAARTGVAVAGPASLKTQLSRWENGHAVPEPEYRALLGTLYERDPAGLGFVAGEPAPAGSGGSAGSEGLTGALAEAEALDGAALDLLRDQVDATARLEHRLGPAAAADVLAAQVERLTALADHVLEETTRQGVCALLAAAALLAGDLERDRARTSASWGRYGTARAASLEAGRPDLAARARAARARLLLDGGEPDRARTLLRGETGDWPAIVRAEADAVTGAPPDEALPPTTGRTGRRRPDAFRPGIAVDAITDSTDADADAIRHRRCLARAAAGDADACTALERAAVDQDRPVRERAEASAALARVRQRDGHPSEALDHARRAQLTALRIGAPRIAALVADVLGPGRDPGGDSDGDGAVQ